MIRMKGIRKKYDTGRISVEALRGIDLEIGGNEYVAVVGPSGSGKSTLMNILGCLDTPSEGEYELSGDAVAKLDRNQLAEIRNKHIGFVFQNFNLLPYATALENVELPLLFGGVKAKERRERAAAMLERVQLGDRMDHKPTELSGGQMQRVAIARALVNRPGHGPGRRAHGQPRLRLRQGDRGDLRGALRLRPDHRDDHPRPGGGQAGLAGGPDPRRTGGRGQEGGLSAPDRLPAAGHRLPIPGHRSPIRA